MLKSTTSVWTWTCTVCRLKKSPPFAVKSLFEICTGFWSGFHTFSCSAPSVSSKDERSPHTHSKSTSCWK